MPHWRLTGATYFITWRIRRSQAALEPIERFIVRDAIRYYDRTRFDLSASVVMDDHVHVIATPYAGQALEKLVHSWKSFSARKIQEIGERRGAIWQKDYFDRIVRDESEYLRFLAYVIENPVRRWPGVGQYPWLDLAGTEAGPTGDFG